MPPYSRVFRRCAAVLLLWPAMALADGTLAGRLHAAGEVAYFVPDRALATLRSLEAEVAATHGPARSRLRSDYLYFSSTAERGLGNLGRALELADELVAYGKQHQDRAALVKGLIERANALYLLDDLPASHASAFEAERAANASQDRASRVLATVAAGQAFQEQGNFPAALSKLQAAADMARHLGPASAPLAHSLHALALLYLNMAQHDKGFETQRELRDVARAIDSPGYLALALRSDYVLAIEEKHFARARRALLQELALERRIGARQMAATTLVNLSDCYLKERKFHEARAYAMQALQAAVEANNNSDIATARINLGQALIGLGRLSEGKQQVERGLATFEQQNDKPELQAILLEYGGSLEQAGDYKKAVDAYHLERRISREMFAEQRTKAVLELQERYDAEKKQRQIEALHQENRAKHAELENHRLQQRVWWLLAAVAVLGSGIVGLLYRKIRQANARLKEKNRELKQQGSLDPLTMLYNRRHFQEFKHSSGCPGEERRRSDSDSVGALFLLDVDHFKSVNDTLGHAAGDMVLKAIAEGLREALRETDMIVRWGGEEFLAFLPAVARDRLDDVAQRILQTMSAQPLAYQGTPVPVTVSVGFAPFPLAHGETPLTWERVVNLIDMALYMAKSHGRNRAYGVRRFSRVGQVALEAIEQDLEQAWRAGHVELSVVLGSAPGAPAPGDGVAVASY